MALEPSDELHWFGSVLGALEATGIKASSVRAYRAALDKWFMPTLRDRSLDRITTDDVEHAMTQMRKANLSDKTIRNYVGTLRALFNFARDKRRRWTTRNPVDDIDLPKLPTYAEIRYLTSDEVWLLADADADAAGAGRLRDVDRAMYLTAAMTGLRIGELQALDWRSVDYPHARIRVRRTWDRKARTFTMPKSRRSERAVHGWDTRTSRRRSATPTTARTPASVTSSRPPLLAVPLAVPLCAQAYGTDSNGSQ